MRPIPSPRADDLASLSAVRGDGLYRYAGTNHSLGGTIDACQELGHRDRADHPRGRRLLRHRPTHATFRTLIDELTRRVSEALPADGVVLNLHGAMVAEGFPDAEAEIARAVRAVVGPTMPIAVTLDFHANIGQEMVDVVDLVTGLRHVSPHRRRRPGSGGRRSPAADGAG
jgi:hypothetical protein